MRTRTLLAAALAATAFGALRADFDINIDLGAKPIRDASESTSKALVGYAGCLCGMDGGDRQAFWFGENRAATSAAMRQAGAWFQRMWTANRWFEQRKPNPYDPNSKDPKEVKRYINEGTEQFSVSLGGFDVKFDGTKNGGQGEGQETH